MAEEIAQGPAAQQQQIEEFGRELFDNAKVSVSQFIAKAKSEGRDVEQTAIYASMLTFVTFMNNNKKFVPSPETDALINMGLNIISAAGYLAKKEADEKRIVAPSIVLK